MKIRLRFENLWTFSLLWFLPQIVYCNEFTHTLLTYFLLLVLRLVRKKLWDGKSFQLNRFLWEAQQRWRSGKNVALRVRDFRWGVVLSGSLLKANKAIWWIDYIYIYTCKFEHLVFYQWKAKNYLPEPTPFFWRDRKICKNHGSLTLQCRHWTYGNMRRHTAKMQAETSAKRLKDRLQTKRPMSYICYTIFGMSHV